MRLFFGVSLAGLLLATLCGIFIGLSSYTFTYAEGTSYLSNDPAACVNCHIMREQFDGWQKAAHHAVATCNDCHLPHDFVGKYVAKAEHGWRHSKAFTLDNFHEPIRITPEDHLLVRDNCVRCHEAFVHDVAQPGFGGLPTLGAAGTETIDCIRCHARVGHGPTR